MVLEVRLFGYEWVLTFGGKRLCGGGGREGGGGGFASLHAPLAWRIMVGSGTLYANPGSCVAWGNMRFGGHVLCLRPKTESPFFFICFFLFLAFNVLAHGFSPTPARSAGIQSAAVFTYHIQVLVAWSAEWLIASPKTQTVSSSAKS